jgi:MFS family permease
MISETSPAESARLTARSGPGGANRWIALVVLSLAQLMVILDSTIVNIALPTAQHDLGFSTDDRQWVVTGYALAFGSLLLLGGRLSATPSRRAGRTSGRWARRSPAPCY